MSEEKLKLIRLMTHKHVFDLLKQLRHGPARFTDLEGACPSERLRSMRLNNLLDKGLVEKKSQGQGKYVHIEYQITEPGKKLALELERLM